MGAMAAHSPSACAKLSLKTCWAASRCSWAKPGPARRLRGKTALIIGAGSSIGSELCLQVARFQPARQVLDELSKFNLYTIEQDLGEAFPSLPLVRLIGDVKDVPHLRQTFARLRPAGGVPRRRP